MKPWTDACSSRAIPSATRRRPASSAVGQQHDDVALRVGRALEHGGQRAGRAGAGGALGGGQHAGAPVVVGGREVVRAHDDHGAALGQVGAELGGAGEDVAAVGHLALEERGEERGLGGLGGAVGRAQALDLATRSSSSRSAAPPPTARRCGAAGAGGRRPRRRRAARASPRPRRRASASARPPSSARRPRARSSSDRSAPATHRARAGRGADDLREPEAGLHRVRHRTRARRGRAAPPLCGRARTRLKG